MTEYYFQTRDEWRNWLQDNFEKEQEAWLIYYKKGSGRERIPYDDAVEEALCFGWIDGKVKSVNKDYYLQRFTPRRKGSRWSRYNVDRVKRMIRDGKMMPAGMRCYEELLKNPSLAYENRQSGYPDIPDDLMKALEADRKALDNFMSFPPSARNMYTSYILAAKKQQTREMRIEKIVGLALGNIKQAML